MKKTFTRIGLGIGATAIAVVIAGAGYQNLSAQGPGGGPGVGRPGGPGGGPMGRRGPGGPGGPDGGMLGPMMLGRLDLTTDQRDRVRQIMDSHREEQKALGDRAMKARAALQDAITATFDESAIRARAADVAAVDADMAVASARVYGEVFQILTSDQQQKLRTLQTEMKDRQETRRKRGL
ncbi:MAG TPA: Spy/CpxP family protein refolding chaperone [Vicinamibacterales bacterium]|nr:Spy/CpxP family protein refolding chaperone [Vicinamibacterales bacterium]